MKNTENQIKNMKEQTIGVEVEMNNITRATASIFTINANAKSHCS